MQAITRVSGRLKRCKLFCGKILVFFSIKYNTLNTCFFVYSGVWEDKLKKKQ